MYKGGSLLSNLLNKVFYLTVRYNLPQPLPIVNAVLPTSPLAPLARLSILRLLTLMDNFAAPLTTRYPNVSRFNIT